MHLCNRERRTRHPQMPGLCRLQHLCEGFLVTPGILGERARKRACMLVKNVKKTLVSGALSLFSPTQSLFFS